MTSVAPVPACKQHEDVDEINEFEAAEEASLDRKSVYSHHIIAFYHLMCHRSCSIEITTRAYCCADDFKPPELKQCIYIFYLHVMM